MSFSSNAIGTTSGTGTVYPSGAPSIYHCLPYCPVFCPVYTPCLRVLIINLLKSILLFFNTSKVLSEIQEINVMNGPHMH